MGVLLVEEKALECQIAVMLRLIGVQPNVRGWRYIVDGVKLVAADEELAHHMTKELYPAIAAKHDTTPSRVERCIRHAIEWAYTYGNQDMLKHYLGNIAAYDKGKATNAAFIAGLASCGSPVHTLRALRGLMCAAANSAWSVSRSSMRRDGPAPPALAWFR